MKDAVLRELRGGCVAKGAGFAGVVLLATGFVAAAPEGDSGEGKAEATPLPKPLAVLNVKNAKGGSIPDGASVVAGSWGVDASVNKLELSGEPLVEGWLEFGPEIREKGASVAARARAPGNGRLRSRMGVGLYGKNGFQLRLDQVRGKVELVRRGEVVLARPFPLKPGRQYEMELSVAEAGGNWTVTGRVHEAGSDDTGEPLFQYLAYADELLFPLAGRAVLVGTPFSGKSVQFAEARVFAASYEEGGQAD